MPAQFDIRRSLPWLAALCVAMALFWPGRHVASFAVEPAKPVATTASSHAAEQFQPFVFMQAGDPQIGWGPIAETQQRFIQLARKANELNVSVVIAVGDLVHNGESADQLKAFKAALSEFRMSVKLLPGNHDSLAVFQKNFGKDYYAFTINNCEFICLNSNLMVDAVPPPAEAARQAQWQFLEKALEAASKAKRTHIILAMHHPTLLLTSDSQKRLIGLIAAYKVKVVLCGHLHRTRELPMLGYTLYAVAGTSKAVDDKGFGYRVFKVYADRIEQQYVPLDAPVPANYKTPRQSSDSKPASMMPTSRLGLKQAS